MTKKKTPSAAESSDDYSLGMKSPPLILPNALVYCESPQGGLSSFLVKQNLLEKSLTLLLNFTFEEFPVECLDRDHWRALSLYH